MAYKVPEEIVEASKALCNALIDAAGGCSAIANSLGWDRQYFHKRKEVGYVHRKHVYDTAKAIGVSPWALAYVTLAEALGEESPRFKDIVNQTDLLPSEKRRILAMIK